MIIDRIDNSDFFDLLPSAVADALRIAAETDFSSIEDGKYKVYGDDMYYIVERYKTRTPEQAKYEVHRKYIDVQIMISGCEAMGYAPLGSLDVKTDYDESSDAAFYQGTEEVTKVIMKAGMYAVFFPQDIHAPKLTAFEQEDVCKVVFKIKA